MMALAQEDSAVASAMPTCSRCGVSSRLRHRLKATVAMPIFTGVAVSARAKKPGASDLIST
jgi:hypothetical protein